VTSAGIILAWLNIHGAFESIQSGRRQAAILGLSWITFLISLALPSFTVFGPVQGFSAAWFAIVGPVESLLKYGQLPIGVIVYLVIDAANILMLSLPLLIWRLRCGRGARLGALLSITMVGTWCVAWDAGDLLFGYYLWCVSFGMALIAIRNPRSDLWCDDRDGCHACGDCLAWKVKGRPREIRDGGGNDLAIHQMARESKVERTDCLGCQ